LGLVAERLITEAEDHHDVHVMDEAGKRLASRRLPEGLTGIRELHELIAATPRNPIRW
jgi:hypothetical protein